MTIRQVYEIMRLRHPFEAGDTPPAYTTCATVLGNLQKKDYVVRKQVDKTFYFMSSRTQREVLVAALGIVRHGLAAENTKLWKECLKEVS